MLGMGKKSRRVKWTIRATIATDIEAKEALLSARDRLRRSGKLLFRGSRMTQESTFGAICLWADDQGVAALEAILAPYVAKLEAIVAARPAHEEAPDDPDGPVRGITLTTKNRAPARGKGKPGGGKPPGTPGSGLQAKGRGKAG